MKSNLRFMPLFCAGITSWIVLMTYASARSIEDRWERHPSYNSRQKLIETYADKACPRNVVYENELVKATVCYKDFVKYLAKFVIVQYCEEPGVEKSSDKTVEKKTVDENELPKATFSDENFRKYLERGIKPECYDDPYKRILEHVESQIDKSQNSTIYVPDFKDSETSGENLPIRKMIFEFLEDSGPASVLDKRTGSITKRIVFERYFVSLGPAMGHGGIKFRFEDGTIFYHIIDVVS
jgi:hypothetical protein